MLHRTVHRTLNLAWAAACWPEARRFERALQDPAAQQSAHLLRLLLANGSCAYGRRFGLERVYSVREFQSALPVVAYEDLQPWIELIKNGEANVLTNESPLAFEKSSGSSAAAKYVPYTASLRAEFLCALAPWVVDLQKSFPEMSKGSAYWVLTPLSREPERTPSGIPVGLQCDSDYFGVLERLLLRKLFAVPRETARLGHLDSSIYVTLRFLLQERDLAFLSVWSPSFLLILLDKLEEFGERLVQDLNTGRATPPGPVDAQLTQRLNRYCRRDLHQAATLHELLQQRAINPRRLWPGLALISCWTSANSASFSRELAHRFSGVTIQGKGLLATEGVVSIPMEHYGGCVAAVRSHFYEFLESEGAPPKLLHELEAGREYSVVLTTGGGLWRYRLGDRVRVAGFARETPMLEFVGREDCVSDLCGEKLNSVFIASVLAALERSGAYSGNFAMLAPSRAVVGSPRYVLFLEGTLNKASLATALDCRLRANPHYAYCRDLGQLAPPTVFNIRRSAIEAYTRRCESLGARAGAVKLKPLDTHEDWERVFSGELSPIPTGVEVGA